MRPEGERLIDGVVVRDLRDDAEAARAIADGFPAPVVLLIDDPAGTLALGALRAGAAAVLPRNAPEREIRATVAAVAQGLVVLGDDARAALLAHAPEALAEPLTPREREVLEWLARGDSNRRIAERMAISEHTVKAHVGAILAKLGASTRTEAVTIGLRRGLLML